MPGTALVVKYPRPRREPGGQSKFTPARVRVILTALGRGYTKTAACGKAHITLDTLAAWIDADEEFAEAVQIAMNHGEAHLLGRIEKAGEDQWIPNAWILERTRQDKYALRTRAIQTDGQSSIPLAVAEEIRRRMEELRAGAINPPGMRVEEPATVEGEFQEAELVEEE